MTVAAAKIGLKGDYHIIKRKVCSDEIIAEYKFENMILNNGLDVFGKQLGGGNGGSGVYLVVGSATSDPEESQSAMSNVVGATSNMIATGRGAQNLSTVPYYVSDFITYRLDAGVATGNLSQVGIGNAANGADLFSLARIKDSAGDPITITKLADEVLDIKYTLQIYCPDDTTGTVTIGGDDYNFVGRAAHFGDWQLIGYLNYGFDRYRIRPFLEGRYGSSMEYYAYPAGRAIGASVFVSPNTANVEGFSGISQTSYVVGSYIKQFKLLANLTSANCAGGVQLVSFPFLYTTFAGYQFEFKRTTDNAAIPKDGTKVMSIDFQLSWGRAS